MSIDASFRSTGITVTYYDVLQNKFINDKFYIITPHITKTQKTDPNITYIDYFKDEDKTTSLNNYIDELRVLFHQWNPQVVLIEDVPYMGNSSSVIDLALLNGAIRSICHMNNVLVYAVNNMTWKKEVLGNGGADKEYTSTFFRRVHPEFKDYTTKQINDVADSYFISRYLMKIPITS